MTDTKNIKSELLAVRAMGHEIFIPSVKNHYLCAARYKWLCGKSGREFEKERDDLVRVMTLILQIRGLSKQFRDPKIIPKWENISPSDERALRVSLRAAHRTWYDKISAGRRALNLAQPFLINDSESLAQWEEFWEIFDKLESIRLQLFGHVIDCGWWVERDNFNKQGMFV